MPQDLVSVIIPAWNAAPFIQDTLSSVLRQSHRNLEVVVVDDCSTDETAAKVEEVSDSRVQLFRLEKNVGGAGALLRGIQESSGEWIARLDADDLSARRRLTIQLRVAKLLGDDYILGSSAFLIGNGSGFVSKRVTHNQLLSQLFFQSPLIHSSVFAHRETFAVYPYDPQFIHVEDYDFIERAVRGGLRLFNLPVPLVKYRLHPGMKSSLPGDAAKLEAQEIQRRLLSVLDIEPSELEIDIHYGMATRSAEHLFGRAMASDVEVWRDKLLGKIRVFPIVRASSFGQVVSSRAKELLAQLRFSNNCR